MPTPLKIAIAAGETSGDLLAAHLIPQLQQKFPNCVIAGVSGEHMVSQGCEQIIDCQELAVMGLAEILTSLPRLYRCRQQFITFLHEFKPDIYIGIDAPDFNLTIAKYIKSQGVFTVQYNSPKVWAWRRYRVKKIQRSIDLMLTQFPFEAKFYEPYQVKAKYCGHPFADVIQPVIKEIKQQRPIIGLAVGSRQGELLRHSKLFLLTALKIKQELPGSEFVLPLINEKQKRHFLKSYEKYAPSLKISIIIGRFREAIAGVDCVLTAAGTATLEIMLLGKPMVVTYQLSKLTYWIAKLLVNVEHVALPNLLAQQRIVPELIQMQATPETLSREILNWLQHPEKIAELQQKYQALRQPLTDKALIKAANYIAEEYANRKGSQNDG